MFHYRKSNWLKDSSYSYCLPDDVQIVSSYLYPEIPTTPNRFSVLSNKEEEVFPIPTRPSQYKQRKMKRTEASKCGQSRDQNDCCRTGRGCRLHSCQTLYQGSVFAAARIGVSTRDIMKAANWPTASTFEMFYKKPVRSASFGKKILASANPKLTYRVSPRKWDANSPKVKPPVSGDPACNAGKPDEIRPDTEELLCEYYNTDLQGGGAERRKPTTQLQKVRLVHADTLPNIARLAAAILVVPVSISICLLLDNCTAHPHDINLRNIRLIILPASQHHVHHTATRPGNNPEL
ncbi:hypothetical protein Bbelb_036110 [Branchiostoma belcheri]|nr:hypothetical protein Bbelb_036110 [Branchiostoma belcheri]